MVPFTFALYCYPHYELRCFPFSRLLLYFYCQLPVRLRKPPPGGSKLAQQVLEVFWKVCELRIPIKSCYKQIRASRKCTADNRWLECLPSGNLPNLSLPIISTIFTRLIPPDAH